MKSSLTEGARLIVYVYDLFTIMDKLYTSEREERPKHVVCRHTFVGPYASGRSSLSPGDTPVVWWCWLFPRLLGVWENVRPFIPRLRLFFLF